MKSPQFCTLYVVRHGQSEGNVKRLMQGHKNYPLTTHGEIQAAQTASVLKDIPFAAVYASDLLRAHRTAQIIALEKKLAVATTEALRERTFGSFENYSYEDYEREFQKQHELIKQLTRQQQLAFQYHPEIESDAQVVSRVFTFLREISLAHLGKNVLIVSHGGVLFSILVHLGVADRKYVHEGIIGNAGYLKLECDGSDFKVTDLYNISSIKLVRQQPE